MKHLFLIGAILALVSCKSKEKESATESLDVAQATSYAPNSDSLVITNNELKETVYYLASDELQGRATGSKGIEKAAQYIETKFKAYNVPPYFETYRDSFKVKALDGYNIVGFIEGNDPDLKNEVLILGAHYDHIGIAKAVAGDSIANGANDDASGTAAVLAMARYFSAKKNNKRSLLFTLYSAEEMGLLGSKHLAKRLKDKGLALYTMINFEMIGVPMTDKDYQAYFTGYELSNMAPKMNDYLGQELLSELSQAKEFQLFKRSDNHPFYEAFHRPSHAISTFDFTNFDYYHHVSDEAEIMDYDFMADLVNRLIPAFETMSNTVTQEINLYE